VIFFLVYGSHRDNNYGLHQTGARYGPNRMLIRFLEGCSFFSACVTDPCYSSLTMRVSLLSGDFCSSGGIR